MYTIYERMIAESQRLDAQINVLNAQLRKLPEGDFFCSRNGKNYKWFQTDGKSQTYIPKKERHLAEQLAIKKYLSLKLKELIREKEAIRRYLNCHNSEKSQAEQLLMNGSGYQDLLSTYFTPTSKELLNWMNSPYKQNTKHPELLIHKTSSGNFVRSKSEAIIDTMLYTHKIPFRYECLLQLGDADFYPDFTIRHPITGKTFYWEHFGLMDDMEYSRKDSGILF